MWLSEVGFQLSIIEFRGMSSLFEDGDENVK